MIERGDILTGVELYAKPDEPPALSPCGHPVSSLYEIAGVKICRECQNEMTQNLIAVLEAGDGEWPPEATNREIG